MNIEINSIKMVFKQGGRLFIAVVLSIIGIVYRLDCLSKRELWEDEYYQIKMIKPPFKAFWLHNYYGDHTSFPGEYLLTYPFVQIFGANKWGLAIPHMVFLIILFYFLYKLCDIYCETKGGLFIAFLLVSYNSNLVFHGLEFRPYAVLPALVMGNLYFCHLIISHYKDLNIIKKALVGVYFIFSVNYHAYGIIMFFLPLFYVIISSESYKISKIYTKNFFFYLISIIIPATLIWGWYALANNFGLIPNEMQTIINNTFEYIPNPVLDQLGFSKAVLGNLIGNKSLYFLLLGIPITMCLSYKNISKKSSYLFILIILPIVLILFIDIISKYWFIQRQFVWVMPLFGLFVAWCWDSIFLALKKKSV